MTNIKIGETMLENVSLTVSAGLLGMNFQTDKTLAELAVLFDAETAPEIRVLDMNGNVTAMYKNHKLTTLQLETLGGNRRVSAALQVTPVESGGANAADIEAMKEQITALEAALNAIEEGIANA